MINRYDDDDFFEKSLDDEGIETLIIHNPYDFFFTACRCEMCIEAKGKRSWKEYRLNLMEQFARFTHQIDFCVVFRVNHSQHPNAVKIALVTSPSSLSPSTVRRLPSAL